MGNAALHATPHQMARHRRRCFSPSPPLFRRHPRAEDPREPARPLLPGKHTPVFPAPRTRAYNPPIPPRIHCKALQRGGIGAGREGKTQNLTHRARGKWSPSGDTGEAIGRRTGPFASCPERRAGRACAAHKGAEDGGCAGIVAGMDTVRKEAPSVRFAMERGADAKTERPMPETGEDHPRPLPLQRDRSRGQKPLNGALKGATYKQSVEAASSAPSDDAL